MAQGDPKAGHEAVKRGRRLAPEVPRWGYEEFFRFMVADEAFGDRLEKLLRQIWPD